MTYFGQPIVPDDSFLRRLPHAINAEQRIRLDALVFSADIIHRSWISMHDLAVSAGRDGDQMTTLWRASLFGAVWQLIYNLDVIRQLISKLNPRQKRGPLTVSLLEALAPAQGLRDGIAHISQKARNLSVVSPSVV